MAGRGNQPNGGDQQKTTGSGEKSGEELEGASNVAQGSNLAAMLKEYDTIHRRPAGSGVARDSSGRIPHSRSQHQPFAHPRSMKDANHKHASACHPERSEGSLRAATKRSFAALRMTALGRRFTFRAVPGEGGVNTGSPEKRVTWLSGRCLPKESTRVRKLPLSRPVQVRRGLGYVAALLARRILRGPQWTNRPPERYRPPQWRTTQCLSWRTE